MKTKLIKETTLPRNADRDASYSIIDGPVWTDGCNHGAGCYVCSFTWLNHGSLILKKYDLYLFPQSWHGTEVCIRYGDKPSHYISPGGLGEFLMKANFADREYRVAARILSELGKTTWEPRPYTAIS